MSQDDLFAFHESHFAKVSVADFGVSFTGLQVPPAPVSTDQTGQVDGNGDEEYYEYEYEEGEGEYGAADDYDDEPFDPSVAHLVPDFELVEPTTEAEEIREAEELRGDTKDKLKEEQDDAEDGEIPGEGGDDEPKLKKKKKRRRKKNGASNINKAVGSTITTNAGSNNDASAKQGPDKRGRQERHGRPQKPDLRKRTWDVVDKGLGSLDYDDTDADPGSVPAPPQRRRIQYED